MKPFEELTTRQKELYRWCLQAADMNEKKAVQYFNTGMVPLADVIQMQNQLLLLWGKEQDDLDKVGAQRWNLEFEKVRKDKHGKLVLKKAADQGHAKQSAQTKEDKKHFLQNFAFDAYGREVNGTDSHLIKLYRKRFSKRKLRKDSTYYTWLKEFRQKV